MFVKTLNAGQICLSPDYVFLKRGLEDKFINELKNVFVISIQMEMKMITHQW